MYGIIGREITKYTVIYGVYTRYTILAKPMHICMCALVDCIFCVQIKIVPIIDLTPFNGKACEMIDARNP